MLHIKNQVEIFYHRVEMITTAVSLRRIKRLLYIKMLISIPFKRLIINIGFIS